MTYGPTLAQRVLPSRAWYREVGVVLAGAGLIAVLAQASAGWPVPMTGQTLGVLLVGGWLGFRRGVAAVSAYLVAGACGAPVFEGLSGGFPVLLGHTGGYLIGFLGAAGTAGLMAEHGFLKTYPRALFTMVVSLIPVYVVGLAWLFPFYPGQVLEYGLWPFLPGAAIKIALAALLTARSAR